MLLNSAQLYVSRIGTIAGDKKAAEAEFLPRFLSISIKTFSKKIFKNNFAINFVLLVHCTMPTEPQQFVGYARDTHSHTRALTRTHRQTYTHVLSLALLLTLTHTRALVLSLVLPHAHTLAHTYWQIYSPSWSPTQNESKAKQRVEERESADNTSELERERRHNVGRRERTRAMRASE